MVNIVPYLKNKNNLWSILEIFLYMVVKQPIEYIIMKWMIQVVHLIIILD